VNAHLEHRSLHGTSRIRPTFDTDLIVYSGTCDDMTQIACNGDDSACSGYTSSLQTPVTAGEQYLIRIGGWDENSTGNLTIRFD